MRAINVLDSHFHGNDPSEARLHGASIKDCGDDRVK